MVEELHVIVRRDSRGGYVSSISGLPDLHVRIPGGTHGDIGTVAMVVNSSRRVVEAPSGLLTMKDLPLVICGGT